MGCTASVHKVPANADIAFYPQAVHAAEESFEKSFAETLSAADLTQWAYKTMGNEKGREAAAIIVQVFGPDAEQCEASLNIILQKLIALASDAYDEETALLAQLAKKNGLSASMPRAPMPPLLWGSKSPTSKGTESPGGGRFFGEKSLPPITSPSTEEVRRIEQQNMMLADTKPLSVEEIKRWEVKMEERAVRRAKGEAVIMSLGLQAATQKVDALAEELTRAKKGLKEAQAKYNEALGAKRRLRYAEGATGVPCTSEAGDLTTQQLLKDALRRSSVEEQQRIIRENEEAKIRCLQQQEQDKARTRQELQEIIALRRRRKTFFSNVIAGGFPAQHSSEVETKLAAYKEEAMEEGPLDQEEESEIQSAVDALAALQSAGPKAEAVGFPPKTKSPRKKLSPVPQVNAGASSTAT